jgi:HSP20 family protein
MADITRIQLRRLQSRLGDIAFQMTQVQFSAFAPPTTWTPAVNAYRCARQITICVDLAGVDKSGLELSVQPRLLTIRGQREAPEPAGKEHSPLQVLAMEIDYGPFERQVELPDEVDTNQVTAQQSNGFVWIYLPFQTHA